MTNTLRIKSNSNKSGPDLKVTFILGQKGITGVNLSPRAKRGEGLIWETEGTSIVKNIKILIDNWMTAFSKKKQPNVELPIVLQNLPPFTLHILTILRSIPFGVSLTYKELAEIAGSQNGARAAGNACGRNPCPLIIPCHRVLAQDGIGGFSCGIDLKRTLLDFEKAKGER